MDSGFLLRILFYFEARRCSRQTGSVYALRINLLNIMIQKTLLKGRGTSIIMKLKESNKEIKIQKKEFTWTRTQYLLVTQVNRMSRSRRVLAIGGKQRILRLDMVCIETILFHLDSF